MGKVSMATLGVLMLLQLPALAANVYVWTDENGVKHYSNMAPSESAAEYQRDKELPPELNSAGPSRIGPAKKSHSPRNAAEEKTAGGPAPAAPQASDAKSPADPDAEYLDSTRLKLKNFPVPQGELVQREKSIVGDLQRRLEAADISRQKLIELEKKRLTKSIETLEKAPLDKFGSQKNKRRQVGYYKYRLEELESNPETYFRYAESPND